MLLLQRHGIQRRRCHLEKWRRRRCWRWWTTTSRHGSYGSNWRLCRKVRPLQKKRSPYFDVSLILRVFTFHWKKRVFPGKDFRKKGDSKIGCWLFLKSQCFLVFLLLFTPQIFLQCWYGGTHHDILAVFKCKRDKQEKKKF